MRKETVLLLFDAQHPCWNEETVSLAGEDPQALPALEREGLLTKEGAFYVLSDAGVERFRFEAASAYYDAAPGTTPKDPRKMLRRNRMELLLRRSFLGRWGLKEPRPGACLPWFPSLTKEELFRRETGDTLVWTYTEHPSVRLLLDRYPLPSNANVLPPNLQEMRAFLHAKNISVSHLELDLLLLQHYDFEQYMHVPPHPNDELGFLNTDRLYCRLAPPSLTGRNLHRDEMDAVCWDIGRLHLFLLWQRRVFLPWFFDRDTEEQDAINWWFWITDTEEEALVLQRSLMPLGEALSRPALPLDLWVLSLEALSTRTAREETFWDLFAETAHSIARTQ
jgi:hypothetical protein